MSILDEMNFNAYAFIQPKTPNEYIALLDEALRLLDELNEQLDTILGQAPTQNGE